MKKGQGLPLNTIVIAIMVLIVLVFVVLFATGAFENLFGQAKDVGEASDTSLVAAQTKCSQWCLQSQNSETVDDWGSSAFCQKTQLLDTDGNGIAGPYSCKSAEINARCSTTISGVQVTQDAIECVSKSISKEGVSADESIRDIAL